MASVSPTGRPCAQTPLLESLPAGLKALRRWVVWRYQQVDTAWKKPLFVPTTGAYASHSDPDTWGSYEDAVAAYERGGFDGIGFVFYGPDRYIGIDLDSAIDTDGRLKKWAHLWVRKFARLGAYTEVSASGNGIHIILPATPPWTNGQAPKHKKTVPLQSGEAGGAAEIYATLRYFTVTGRPIPEVADIPVDREQSADAVLANFYHWFVSLEGHSFNGKTSATMTMTPTTDDPETIRRSPKMTTEEILGRCRDMNNGKGEEFCKLFDSPPAEGEDESRGDWALAGKLLYWTQDIDQVDALMRSSNRVRPKWDKHPTYLRDTVRKCLQHKMGREVQGKTEFYAPTIEVNTGVGPGNESSPGPARHTPVGAWTWEQIMELPKVEMAQMLWDKYNLDTNPTITATDSRVTSVTWWATRRFPGIPLDEDQPELVRIHLPEIAKSAKIHPKRAGKILRHCGDVGLIKRKLHRSPKTGHTFLYAGAPEEVVLNCEVIPDAEERKKDKKATAERRKRCKYCECKGFLHYTECLECGAKLEEYADGSDEELVGKYTEMLAEAHAHEGWEPGIETVVVEPEPGDESLPGSLATEGQFTQFLNTTNLTMHPSLRLHTDVLDNFYYQWCHEEGEEKAPRGALHRWLEEEGCVLSAEWWHGIGLVLDGPEGPGNDSLPGPLDALEQEPDTESAAGGGPGNKSLPSDHSVWCSQTDAAPEPPRPEPGGPGNESLPGPEPDLEEWTRILTDAYEQRRPAPPPPRPQSWE